MHGYWTMDYGPDVVPNAQRIQATPAAKAIYTRAGRLYAIGEVMVQEDLARTLERLASGGPDAFYKVEIAEEIAWDFEANGGFITGEDLEGYRVNVTEPIRGTYRGLQVAAAGPPAGGLTLLQMLNFLEGFDLAAHGWPSTEAARLLVEAMAWALADRQLHVADPRFVEIPIGALADKQHAAAARQVVLNVLDREMSPVEAVSAPRVDFQGDVVQAEARIPRVVCEGLERLGYAVNRRTLNYDSYFARPQLIVAEHDGFLSGASDPRKDGGAAFETETK